MAAKYTITTTSPRYLTESKDTKTIFEFFDRHRDDLKYMRSGYKQKLIKLLEAETGMKVTINVLTSRLKYYRLLYDCPIHAIPNKYYVHRGRYQVDSECAEHRDSVESSSDSTNTSESSDTTDTTSSSSSTSSSSV